MRSFGKHLLDFCLVLGGKVSSLGVVFIGGILVARCAGPAEYGLFSVAISAILLCEGMIGAPLDVAAVRFSSLHAGEPGRTQRFEAMAMHVKIIAVAVLFLAAVSLQAVYRQWYAPIADGSFPFFSCFFATVSLLLARSIATGLQIRRRFTSYSLLDVAQGAGRLLGFVLLAALHQVKTGICVLMYGLAGWATVIYGLAFLGQKYLLGRWPTQPDVRRMLRYCGYSAGIVGFGTIAGRGDLLILAAVNGAENVSAYGLASQVSMLLTQLAFYASILTQPRVIPLARNGALRRLFLINFLLVAFAALVAAGTLSPALLRWGTTLLFGSSFDGSIPVLQILLVGSFLDLLMAPVLMVFCVQACPAQVVWGEALIAGGFLVAGLAAATSRFGWPPEQAMAWVAGGARLAKLILYGGLFSVHTSPAAVAALKS